MIEGWTESIERERERKGYGRQFMLFFRLELYPELVLPFYGQKRGRASKYLSNVSLFL